MTKADIVSNISEELGIDRADVQATVEKFMKEVKGSLEKGENVIFQLVIKKKRDTFPIVKKRIN